MTTDAVRELSIAYLISQYPSASHSFIQREIDGLRALGTRVDVFSVRQVPPELLLDSLRDVAAATTVIQNDKVKVALDIARVARSQPRGFGAVLRRALGTGPRTARARSWQVFYLAEAIRLYVEMRRRGLRHVHAHFANNGADIARLVVALGRAVDGSASSWSWSFTMHGPTEFEAVDRFDLAAKVRDADGVACITDFARSQLMRLVTVDLWPKLHIVPMSVDLDLYDPPTYRRSHPGPLRLLAVGRLVPEKGWSLLVEAVADVLARGVDVHLSVVGVGELEAGLRDQVSALMLDERVNLVGALGQDRLPDLYRWADVFCLASFQEGLPVVIMEAMATELPVIATSIAGIPELVTDGVSGRVVTPGRVDLISDAILALAEDPTVREAMGRRGRVEVERRHATTIAARAQQTFLAAVTRQGHPS